MGTTRPADGHPGHTDPGDAGTPADTPDSFPRSEGLYRLLVELSPDAVFVIKDGYHVFANRRGLALFGARDVAELRRWPALAYMHGPGAVLAAERMSRMVDDRESLDYVEEQVRTLDGRVVDIEAAGIPVTYDGATAALVVVRDITERRRAEDARRRAEARFRSTFSHAPIGMAILGPDDEIRVANPALCAMLGTVAGRLVGRGVVELAALESRPALRSLLHDELDTPEATREIRMTGRERDVWALVSAATTGTDREGHVLVQLVDITARKEAEERLSHLAWHDPLTGLANRSLLQDRLTGALGRSRRSGHPVGVFFVDLDGFKEINDTWGHEWGDIVLCEVASRLVSSVREGETVARLGGDEFVVLAEQGDTAAYATLATRIHEALRKPLREGQDGLPLSASVGLAVCSGVIHPTDAIREADAAMYESKQQSADGEAHPVVRTPGITAQSSSRWASSGANAGRQTATYSAPSGWGVV